MPESETIEGFTSRDSTHGGTLGSVKPAQDHDKVKSDFTRETDKQTHHDDEHEFSKEEQHQQ